MSNKLDLSSKNIINENIKYIEKKFPNVVIEGKIDFEELKQELLNDLMDDNKEKYQLTWAGKNKAKLNANKIINKTLLPLKSKSIEFDVSKNIYIEGDNLEALKILQESYLNKIKCIYIDPPYNTGNDFVYNDIFQNDTDNELEESGQVDEYNNKLISNTDSNGRFHSDWLSMIYPRLKLARNLLKNNGVIFISIDDNEYDNLKKICDEIFGERNYVGTIIWERAFAPKNDAKYLSSSHDYILSYAKSKKFKASIQGKDRKYYETEDFPGRPWRIHDMTKQTTASERPNSFFTYKIGILYSQKVVYYYRFLKEDEEPIIQNLIYSIEGNQLIMKDPNDPSGQEPMIIKRLTAGELVLGLNSEDSAVINQSLVAIGYSVYHEITFRKISLN